MTTEGEMADDFDRRLREDPELARFQAMYLDGGVDGISLVAADSDACPACLALTDRSYIPEGLPALPLAGCTAVGGCRCRYEPNVTVYE
jgi:hypothetical protein